MNKIFAAVLAGAMLLVVMGFSTARAPDTQNHEEEITEPVFDPRAMSNLFADISEMVGPSVVTITSKTTVTAPSPPMIPWGFGFWIPESGRLQRVHAGGAWQWCYHQPGGTYHHQ
ncbi:MAG: hypothetical protein GQ565_13735 [Candidatus Aegiribacteria sp.]|nr:hypothetical protein [Candidatus Aegiribacteria sp.]